jgi:hypothetical protein
VSTTILCTAISLILCLYVKFFFRFKNDQKEFIRRSSLAVQESLQRIYDNTGPASSLVFTEPKPMHEEIIRRILLDHHDSTNEHESSETS